MFAGQQINGNKIEIVIWVSYRRVALSSDWVVASDPFE